MNDFVGWIIPSSGTMQAALVFSVVSMVRLLFMFGISFSLYNNTVGTRWEKPVKVIVVPLFLVSFIYDVFLNYTVAAIWFWERPQHWRETISARMRRYLREKNGWRAIWSKRICTILNMFDRDHCASERRDKTAALKKYVGLR